MLNSVITKISPEQELILACDRVGARIADNKELSGLLANWIDERTIETTNLIQKFVEAPLTDWERIISNHGAARHPWYDYLADKSSLSEFQNFLREESRMPPFVPILERVEAGVGTQEAKAALAHNISDEKYPVPHANLFTRMVDEVCESINGLTEDSPELAATNLVFYHCMTGPIGFALGALYATELMVPRRAKLILKCLQRFDFSTDAQEFMRIHAEVDQGHAADWMYRVIVPELRAGSCLKVEVAAGVTVRLAASLGYLSSLNFYFGQ